jgi:CRISPR-associated protein (TIGR03986 family)
MATAPYRFIPIEPDFTLKPPVARSDIRFDTPLALGSVSAVLDLQWTAKTPVCIGASGEDAREVLPLKIGSRYCLSGTSLRGMVRSVLEIATFSHLGRINANHHYGVREFTGLAPHHAIAVDDVKAGWLKLEGKTWKIYPVRHKDSKFVLAPIESILSVLPAGHSITFTKWQEGMSVAEKYASLPSLYQLRPIKYFYALEREGRGLPRACLTKNSPGSDKSFQSKTHPIKDMYLVCTGPYRQEATAGGQRGQTGTPKKNEALFPAAGDASYVIPQEWMDLFHSMNADASRSGGNPRGAWRTWLRAKNWTDAFSGFKEDKDDENIPDCMKDPNLGIPVFWKGDLAELESLDPANPGAPGLQSFWFSLSRVMRVPHGYSVGNAAKRLYSGMSGADYHVPRLAEKGGWDFARALFGEVDGANTNPKDGKREKGADNTRREDAQRGRVAIGFAYAPPETKLDPKSQTGVLAQPRDSFWPFYLRHSDVLREGEMGPDKTVSYSSEYAVPAGRKRTVVRRTGGNFPQGNGNESTKSTVRFLPAGTVFKGQIRVHNLHPVELGALLFALTLGAVDGSRWHQIGRAKGMGHGALSPQVSFAKAPLVVADPSSGKAPGQPTSIEQWISLYVDWVSERMEDHGLPPFKQHPALQMLDAMANPAIGDAMAASKQLDTGELPNFKIWKDAAKCLDGQGSGPYSLSDPRRAR